MDEVVTAEEPAPELRVTRVNETRYVRTFTCEQIHKILAKAVLDEAYLPQYATKRDIAKVVVLSPGVPESLTVKVTVPE